MSNTNLHRFHPPQETENCPYLLSSVTSDIGCVRGKNEDNYILGNQWNAYFAPCKSAVFSAPVGSWQLYSIFDGMGGGEAGELASAVAANTLLSQFQSIGKDCSTEQIDAVLRAAFLEANNQVIALRKQYRILGTTGTVLCTDGNLYKIFHLGDSRAYLFQNNALFPLTKDQTVAQMKLDLGVYDPAAPDAQAEQHQLTQFIGHDKTQCYLKPKESPWHTAAPGRKILLCSDGLYNSCSTAEICTILGSSGDVREQTDALCQCARHNGGEDNITCLLVAFP